MLEIRLSSCLLPVFLSISFLLHPASVQIYPEAARRHVPSLCTSHHDLCSATCSSPSTSPHLSSYHILIPTTTRTPGSINPPSETPHPAEAPPPSASSSP